LGAAGNAGAGQIYKLPNVSGVPVPFALLPQGPMGEGIGNLDYDCGHQSLYASDFNDGKIYRVDATGTRQPNAWDHGVNLPSALPVSRSAITGFDGSSSYAALGRRVWAVRVYKNRLYYSVWSQDWSRTVLPVRPHGSSPTEIWSVALAANGDPFPPARLEITLPPFSTALPYTNPVSDISFGPLGTMLVAERTMTGNNSSYAHCSRVLEYSFNGTTWMLPNPLAYQIGVVAYTPDPPANSAGGVAFDFGPGGRVWTTGDAIHFGPDYIYGLQGLPAGGGDVTTSILIDLDDNVNNSYRNKSQIGDVRVPCLDCASAVVAPVITGPQSTCVSPSHYSVAPQPGVTYSWTVTGGTPTTGAGTSIDVTWSGSTAGTITVTASGTGDCGAVTSTIQVAPCSINCPFCDQFNTQVLVPSPAGVGAGGLETVTPTVTSTMPGVTSATVTLLNASVAYSPGFCGASGPLPAYIPQAFTSSAAGFSAPFLPVPNGNQAIWQAGSPVNLAGGATTPFQLHLGPPPPAFEPCHAIFSFCLRVSLANADCKDCDVIRCFGPFQYAPAPIVVVGGGNANLELFVLPGVLTFAVPPESYLARLMDFLQDQGDMALPRRFVMDHLSFEPGKASVTDDSLPALDQLAMILKAYSTLEVRLVAYADDVGDAGANRRLALERAQALKTLLQRAGAPPDQVAVDAQGAARPPAPNETKGGGTPNGGVDLFVLHK
jgi:hypothetical protein